MFSEWKPGTGFLNKEEDTVRTAAGGRVMERESVTARARGAWSRACHVTWTSQVTVGASLSGSRGRSRHGCSPIQVGEPQGLCCYLNALPPGLCHQHRTPRGGPAARRACRARSRGAAMGRGRRREGGTEREPLSQADSQASLFQRETVRIKRLESFWKNLGKTPDRRKG